MIEITVKDIKTIAHQILALYLPYSVNIHVQQIKGSSYTLIAIYDDVLMLETYKYNYIKKQIIFNQPYTGMQLILKPMSELLNDVDTIDILINDSKLKKDDIKIIATSHSEGISASYGFETLKPLIEKHYDVFNLIEKNMAIHMDDKTKKDSKF